MKEKTKMLCKLEEFAGMINTIHKQWLNGYLSSMEELAYLMKKATAGTDRELNGWRACTLADAIQKGLTPEAVAASLKENTKIILGID